MKTMSRNFQIFWQDPPPQQQHKQLQQIIIIIRQVCATIVSTVPLVEVRVVLVVVQGAVQVTVHNVCRHPQT